MAAASEPGRDALKAIQQRHLEDGILQVLAAKRVMRQSLFVPEAQQQHLGNQLEIWRILQGGVTAPLTISILAMVLALLALIVAINR